MTGYLRVKAGVQFHPIAAGFRILGALEMAARSLQCILTISCGSEGHPDDDPHTTGEAFDVSVLGMTATEIVRLRDVLMSLLPADLFTVLYEVPTQPEPGVLQAIAYVNSGASAPHFHIQRKRGTTYPPTTTTIQNARTA